MRNQTNFKSNTSSVPDWAKAFADDAYFAQEQACLGEVWTFIGFESDIPNLNDWFRATLGGRSIFIQRFKDGLRAFENICPHRFNQIRCEDKGNGHVVCGFHHWQFNSKGDAVGIPKCKEYYGKTPTEIGASLTPVEIAICGGFIFGRFGEGPSLKEWLGDGYDVLHSVTKGVKFSNAVDYEVNAHWKLMMQISLDDYHATAIHPTTFGKNGYLHKNEFNYTRFGAHSALTMGEQFKDANAVVSAFRLQAFHLQKSNYVIFQFFPTFIVAFIPVGKLFGDDYCYLLIQHFIPQARHKTRFHTRFFLMPFKRRGGFLRRMVRLFTVPIVNKLFKHFMIKVNKEDNQVCENMQKVSDQIHSDMLTSALEQRLSWFENIYQRYVTDNIKQKDG